MSPHPIRRAVRAVAALGLALLLTVPASCGGGAGPGFGYPGSMWIDDGDSAYCCDPLGAFPQVVATLEFFNDQDVDEPMRVDFTDLSGRLFAVPSFLEVPPGESRGVVIFANDCPEGSSEMSVRQSFRGVTVASDTMQILSPEYWAWDEPAWVLHEVLFPFQPHHLVLLGALAFSPIGLPVLHSALSVPPKVPSVLWTEIAIRGALRRGLTTADLLRLFPPARVRQAGSPPELPDGAGPNGFTIAATPGLLLEGGDYIVAWQATTGTIPLADPAQTYQYGFVFDADGVAANNYVPSASFPNDFFKGTDRWYEVRYTPATGWSLVVTDARNGAFLTVSSAATAVISDNTITLVVPASEFQVQRPTYRVTAFCHLGDFGIPAPHDWSGDLSPSVAEGLAPIPPGP